MRESFEIITANPTGRGFEETNDALLREQIWRTLLTDQPGTIVLATGDGNG
jgi:hypothetical protein